MMIKEYKHDKVTTFPYGTNVFKVCENEMLSKNKWCANWIMISKWLYLQQKYQGDKTLEGISTAKISKAWVR